MAGMRTAVTTLVTCVGLLMALGMVMLYSASTVSDGAKFLGKQLAWGGVGLVAAVSAACLPVRLLRELKWLRWGLIALALFLLVIVLIPGIGKAAGGARRWLSVGFGQFQPSELAKLAAIVFLAWYGDLHARRMGEFKVGYLYPILAVGLAMGLIFLEPDWGTALLIGTVAGGMLIVAGAKLRYLLTTAALGFVLLSAAIWHNDVRRERLLAFLDLEKYKETTGYQQWQAQLALGAGGWEGKGLGDGRQKLGFVPEHHTDFILSVIGEELGAMASLGVLAAFAAIVLAGTYIAMRARDTFSQLLVAGITMMIGLQAILNVAVVTASLPNKGISLPFISYGGSNLVVMLGCVGLLLSVARDAAWQPETQTQPGEAGELCFPQLT